MQTERRLGTWPPSYRHGLYWLSGATVAALVLGIAVRVSEGVGVLLLLFLPLALAIWFIGLLGFSAICAWRARRQPLTAVKAMLAPVVGLGLFALILVTVWRAWGIVPWAVDGTSDVHVNKHLPSPDGHWQAIYVDDLSGGPATGTGKDVYLVRGKTSTLSYADRVFSAECVQDLELQWIEPRTLQITYTAGDTPPIDGLLPPRTMPWFHSRQDEWKRTDPVKVVQVRRVYRGSSC